MVSDSGYDTRLAIDRTGECLRRHRHVDALTRRRQVHAAGIAIAFILVEAIDKDSKTDRAIEVVRANRDRHLRAREATDTNRREHPLWNHLVINSDLAEPISRNHHVRVVD